MNKLKFALAASLLATGVAHAASNCDGFKITLKNNLSEDLVLRKIHLQGGDIQPGGIKKLDHKSAKTFTISQSLEEGVMKGELVLNTLTLPSKEVRVQFDLENKGLICEHSDYSPTGDLALTKHRLAGEVKYSINNQ